jgi:chromosomal replication initiation ATPase DnaA
LLRGVLVKHFNDHQIAVGEAVVSYLLTRMPRSLAFAREIVAEIDAEALAARAEVTRPFVAKVLDRRLSPQIFHHDGD